MVTITCAAQTKSKMGKSYKKRVDLKLFVSHDVQSARIRVSFQESGERIFLVKPSLRPPDRGESG